MNILIYQRINNLLIYEHKKHYEEIWQHFSTRPLKNVQKRRDQRRGQRIGQRRGQTRRGLKKIGRNKLLLLLLLLLLLY